jgi:undecaprenyl-diphosphatase
MITHEPDHHRADQARAPRADRPRSGLRSWPLGWRELGLLVGAYVILSLACTAIGLLLTRVLDGAPLLRDENAVNSWFARQRTPGWDDLSLIGSDLADTRVKIALVLLVGTAFVLAWRRWNESLQIAVSLLLEVAVFGTAQQLVDRPRPPVEQLDGHLPTSSFPSGHVAASVAFYVGIAMVIFAHTRRGWARALGILLAVVVPAVVLLSRLYRGMHHVSDVSPMWRSVLRSASRRRS